MDFDFSAILETLTGIITAIAGMLGIEDFDPSTIIETITGLFG